MTLTATALTSASASGVEAQTVTTGSFTPGASRKLYLVAFGISTVTGIDLTAPSSTGGLTIASAPTFQDTQNSSDTEFGRLAVWEVTVGGSPAASTVTFDAGASTKTAWISYAAFDVVGSTGTPGIKSGQIIGNRGAGAGGNAVTGPSGTLPASGTTGNLALILSGRNNDATGVATAPAAGGFSGTALFDTAAAVFVSVCGFQSSTFTSTTATIADLGQQISCWSTILLEIEEVAAGGATGPFDPRWDYRSPVLRM